MWPESTYGPNDVGTLPICDGDVKIIVRSVNEPDWGGTYATTELEATCSRCKQPYFPGRIDLDYKVKGDWDITSLLEKQ